MARGKRSHTTVRFNVLHRVRIWKLVCSGRYVYVCVIRMCIRYLRVQLSEALGPVMAGSYIYVIFPTPNYSNNNRVRAYGELV